MATPDIRVELVTSLDTLEGYAAAWDEIACATPNVVPMCSHAWVASYLEHRLLPNQRWCCVLALEGDRLLGVLPLLVERRRLWGFARTLLRCPADLHTTLVDAVAIQGRENDVWQAVLGALHRVASDWYAVDMGRVVGSSPSLCALQDPSAPVMVMTRPAGSGHYLPTEGSFETYRGSLRGKLKRNLGKAWRELERLGAVEITLVEGAAASELQLPKFKDVEALNWKGREGTAIAGSEGLLAFYTTLTRRLSQRGWLAWQFLEARGKAIAAAMIVRCGHSWTLWKIGYDDRFARYSPGSMLMEHLVRRAYESDEVGEVNLITKQAWLEKWGVQTRDYEDVLLYRRRPLTVLARVAPRRMRSALRHVPGISRLARGLRGLRTRAR